MKTEESEDFKMIIGLVRYYEKLEQENHILQVKLTEAERCIKELRKYEEELNDKIIQDDNIICRSKANN